MLKRDEKGRFAKGNGGGPGRPRREREEKFLEITRSACTYADWRKIVKKAVDQAKRGNYQARKFLADYLLGTPPQRHEITGEAGGAIELVNTVVVREYLNDEESA